jgi:hypothetical protein
MWRKTANTIAPANNGYTNLEVYLADIAGEWSRRSPGCEDRPVVIPSEASRTGVVFRDQTGIERISSRESGADVI